MQSGAYALALAFGSLAVTACTLPAPGHVILYIEYEDPQASLPPDPDADPGLDAGRPLPAQSLVFDTLRVEVVRAIDDGGVSPVPGTRAEFDLHAGLFADGPVSLTLVPDDPLRPMRVAVTIFRRARRPSRFGTDLRLTTVERIPAPGDAELEYTVRLSLQSLLETPKGSAGFQPGPTGESIDALLEGCPVAADDNEVCVPGGVFWMGDPALYGNQGSGLEDSDRERPVMVSAFLIDRHEVTMAEFCALPGNCRAGPGAGDEAEAALPAVCKPVTSDADAPVTCVDWDAARSYCAAFGKDLPTEAEWEFVASGLGADKAYPWGNDAPHCDDVVVNRGETGCPGPVAPGRTDRDDNRADALQVGVDAVLDLAGNVSEWTVDRFSDQDELARDRVRTDAPIEMFGGPVVVKGGSFRSKLVAARAAARAKWSPSKPRDDLGFRCVRAQRGSPL